MKAKVTDVEPKKTTLTMERNKYKNVDLLLLGGILLFCLIYRIIYFRIGKDIMLSCYSDSVTNFTSGIFDLYRTPVYPLVIKTLGSISKDNLYSNLIIFQQIISFLSIIPLFCSLKNTLNNRAVIIVATIGYACIPYLLQQNVLIAPESLGLVCSTFILFLFSHYIKKPSSNTAFCLGFFPLVLIMLKPTYLITLCIIFLFFIVRFIFHKNEKRILCYGVLGLLVAVSGVLGYSAINKKINGEFTLSQIVLNNSLANIVISGAYKYGDDEELISIIDTTKQEGFYFSVFTLNNQYIDKYKMQYEKFPENLVMTPDMEFCKSIPDTYNYPHIRLNQFVKRSQYTATYFKYIARRLIDMFIYHNSLLSVMILFQSIAVLLFFLKQKKIL
jgi:hypothetical protein